MFQLKEITPSLFEGGHGLEREMVRIHQDGLDNPVAFHAEINESNPNPAITVDFADNQVELVTPVTPNIKSVINHLKSLHQQLWQRLPENEYIWSSSIPPWISSQQIVRTAVFDATKEGQVSHDYRVRLVQRYCAIPQYWSGLHYNVSFGDDFIAHYQAAHGLGSKKDARNQLYAQSSRAVLRDSWFILLLFGATPHVSNAYWCFIREHLKERGYPALFESSMNHMLSIRNSIYGYPTHRQHSFHFDFNTVQSYVDSIKRGMQTPDSVFEQLGCDPSTLLQNEREIYTPVRIKAPPQEGRTLLETLENEGAGYIEIRALDLMPFESIGVDQNRLYVLHLLILYRALGAQASLNVSDYRQALANFNQTALSGRDLTQTLAGHPKPLNQMLRDLVDELANFLVKLPQIEEIKPYREAFEAIAPDLRAGKLLGVSVLETLGQEDDLAAYIAFSKVKNQTIRAHFGEKLS